MTTKLSIAETLERTRGMSMKAGALELLLALWFNRLTIQAIPGKMPNSWAFGWWVTGPGMDNHWALLKLVMGALLDDEGRPAEWYPRRTRTPPGVRYLHMQAARGELKWFNPMPLDAEAVERSVLLWHIFTPPLRTHLIRKLPTPMWRRVTLAENRRRA